MAMMPLPVEIEIDILLRLPTKTLKRLTSVCKSWNSIIKSPGFISDHLHRSSLNPHLLLLKHPHPLTWPTIQFSIVSESFVEQTSLQVPHDPVVPYLHPKRIEIVSANAINGIVCFVVYMGLYNGPETQCDMFLWNPSIRDSVKIPGSGISGLFLGLPMVRFYTGFGYVDGIEEYKLVRVVYLDSVNPTVEVYSLWENCWRELDSQSRILSNIIWASTMCTFVNGVGHWGAYRKEMKERFFILGFDFRRECFKKVKLPLDCVDGREMRYHSIWDHKGLLAMSVLHFGEFDSCATRHYIWVMVAGGVGKREQWIRVFNINLLGGPRKPVATLTSGELLLLGESDGDHVLYKPLEELVKGLDTFDFDAVIPYADSLVSLSQLMPK